MKLGVDCGNVILKQMNGTPLDGALEALALLARDRRLAGERGIPNIWVVSKCGPRMQSLTLEWLQELDFWNVTGIPADHIRFCLKYEQKEPICRQLGITHFVDDRPRVLNCLVSVPHLYAFNPEPAALTQYQRKQPLTVVQSWGDLLPRLQLR